MDAWEDTKLPDTEHAKPAQPMQLHDANTWHAAQATHAALLVDCANYYRALYHAICEARHSIFILGWDIDSRIELLRGEEAASASCPPMLYELLTWKAGQNPAIQIYLNRWNYSVFLAAERESFSEFKWKWQDADNIHFVFDGQLPLGASHHQKVVVVDDELAFCGGMDVAIARWDKREHHTEDDRRVDPDGTLKLGAKKEFGPYHDIQAVVAGPVVQPLATLVRERWHQATGKHAIPTRMPDSDALPAVWPKFAKPALTNIRTAVALTQPAFLRQPVRTQIKQLYLDMIARAEQFIYMENQFFTQKDIARALNKRLKERPGLRALLISCDRPQGIMERKSMYTGRVHFKELLEAGGVGGRVVMAYPASSEHGEEKAIRIHSKLMVVDDHYLRVGSSNINRRSMTLDTECDLMFEAHDEATQQAIAGMRNDLIREHTGRELDDIQQLISSGASVQTFLEDIPHSRQHLRRINDEAYRHERFSRIATWLADPAHPLLPRLITSRGQRKQFRASIPPKLVIAVLAIIALVLAWKVTPLSEYATPEKIVPLLEKVKNTAWAFPAGMAAYIVGTLIFFPHMIMTATVVIVFPPMEAFLIAMLGSLVSCIIGFFAGKQLGEDSLRALTGRYAKNIAHYADKGGLVGLTLLRLVPIAPYTVVNLALGMMNVPFWRLMAATVLGMLPGTAVSVLLGQSALSFWKHPDMHNMLLLGGGLLAWILIIVLSHLAAKHWQTAAK
ncbi:VTT domain-containing protein [Methylovorus sp. MP688]|uniref:VTT domain-containing protein n=1 Tax=Methylovorus sp. (strain MP688) TaxID=887061 RepID=UPI0001EC46F6|nr:VTT domain-containing protein [Methylovorus sp. MP688]ADQ84568.1 Phospholipase D [Methylovorus sp. MP688]